MPQPLVQEPQPDTIAPPVQPGDCGLGERDRTCRATRREGRLGGILLERGLIAPIGSEGKHRFEREELVRGCVQPRRLGRRGSEGRSRCLLLVRREPVMCRNGGLVPERGGDGAVVADAREWQEILLDRLPDELVAEVELLAVLDQKSMLDCLRQARGQIGIQHGSTSAWPTRGAWRQTRGTRLEDHGRGGELGRRQGHAGRCEEPQQAPAFGTADREPCRDELLEAACGGDARQLAPGKQELLGRQRAATRALGHQEQDAGGRSLTLDRFDQARHLRAGHRLQRDRADGPGCRGDDGAVRGPRVGPRDLVRPVAHDEGQPLRPRDPGQERDESARRRVGPVHVLENEHDRPLLAKSPEHAEDSLERPGLPSLQDRSSRARRQQAKGREPRSELGHEPRRVLPGRTRHTAKGGIVKRCQDGSERAQHGAEGSIGTARGGAVQHDHRLGEVTDPADRLLQEARDADPGRAGHEERPCSPLCCSLQDGREAHEGRLTPDETRARQPRGHGPF